MEQRSSAPVTPSFVSERKRISHFCASSHFLHTSTHCVSFLVRDCITRDQNHRFTCDLISPDLWFCKIEPTSPIASLIRVIAPNVCELHFGISTIRTRAISLTQRLLGHYFATATPCRPRDQGFSDNLGLTKANIPHSSSSAFRL